MFFKKKPRDEIDEIREAMEEPIEEYPSPRPSRPMTAAAMPAAPSNVGAPLFVKVEKYREIITTIQEMKLFASGIKQLFSILSELEALRSDTINIMRATVQRLEKSMSEIDAELLRPRGLTIETSQPAADVSHVENTLEELQNQLAALRKELHEMR